MVGRRVPFRQNHSRPQGVRNISTAIFCWLPIHSARLVVPVAGTTITRRAEENFRVVVWGRCGRKKNPLSEHLAPRFVLRVGQVNGPQSRRPTARLDVSPPGLARRVASSRRGAMALFTGESAALVYMARRVLQCFAPVARSFRGVDEGNGGRRWQGGEYLKCLCSFFQYFSDSLVQASSSVFKRWRVRQDLNLQPSDPKWQRSSKKSRFIRKRTVLTPQQRTAT